MVVEYWQRIIGSGMAVPSDRPLTDLTAELVDMLGSPDPTQRDGVAFDVLAGWIHAGVYDDLLASLGDSVSRGLAVGLGSRDGDTVFRRSFSALVLAACVERDNRAQLLPVDVVMRWAERSLTWFTHERDDRGWVENAGWAHSVAHGADLIGAIAASRRLDAAHLGVLLDVIAERLASTTAFLHAGEDDRLALAVLTVVQRELLPIDTLETWLETVASLTDQTRHTPLGEAGPTPAAHNATLLLRALFTHLSIGIGPSQASLGFAAAPRTRADLLLALVGVLPRSSRWLYSSVTSVS
ncbi:MAG: DUF2785 domain-containing protein [Actinomycetota bacterium]|nr:DUF2785 domain-containing protein [Actinomycetota bacterium]